MTPHRDQRHALGEVAARYIDRRYDLSFRNYRDGQIGILAKNRDDDMEPWHSWLVTRDGSVTETTNID